MKKLFGLALLLIALPYAATADMVWGFKSPAFHYGNGYSTHVLSVEQLQHNRKEELRKQAASEASRLERELDNSVLNKFIRNVESRIYANLSKLYQAQGSLTSNATDKDAFTDWIWCTIFTRLCYIA